MAVTRNEVQVLWSAANSVSVSGGSTGTSDAFAFSATAIAATIQLKIDHSGSPVAGDTVDFYLLRTNGDPDGASTDEYDTTTQGEWLATLDPSVSDPAIRTVAISPASKGGKIYAKNNDAGDAQTVSATIYETLAS